MTSKNINKYISKIAILLAIILPLFFIYFIYNALTFKNEIGRQNLNKSHAMNFILDLKGNPLLRYKPGSIDSPADKLVSYGICSINLDCNSPLVTLDIYAEDEGTGTGKYERALKSVCSDLIFNTNRVFHANSVSTTFYTGPRDEVNTVKNTDELYNKCLKLGDPVVADVAFGSFMSIKTTFDTKSKSLFKNKETYPVVYSLRKNKDTVQIEIKFS